MSWQLDAPSMELDYDGVLFFIIMDISQVADTAKSLFPLS